jgi:hypothetical protein
MPDVAALSGGGFVSAWASEYQDGDGFAVVAQRVDGAGRKVGPEILVNTTAAHDQWRPTVAGLRDGGFAVAWMSWEQDGWGQGIFGRTFDADGTPRGGEFAVNTTTFEHQDYPDLAATADGSLVVVWASMGPIETMHDVYGRRFSATGTPLGDEFLVNTTTAGNQWPPAVAAMPQGGFVVTWMSTDPYGSEGIFAQRFGRSGAPVGGEFRVNTTTVGSHGEPDVAPLPGGGFVIAWDGTGAGDGDGVFVQRFAADGNKMGTETLANTHLPNEQHSPAVAVRPDGSFFVAWSSRGQEPARPLIDVIGDDGGVYGRAFMAGGVAVGEEIHLNAQTEGGQSNPVVATGADGSLVAIWQGEIWDMSLLGVFGRVVTFSGNQQSPFHGVAFPVGDAPVSIEAEDFDLGGEGLAYHDTTPSNAGGIYRPAEGVDLRTFADRPGGVRIADARAGEWTEYTVSVARAGRYTLEVRAGNPRPGATFHVEVDGGDVTGPMAVPFSRWSNRFGTVRRTVVLPAGEHVLRLSLDAAPRGGSVGTFDAMRITPARTAFRPATQDRSVIVPPAAVKARDLTAVGDAGTALLA